MRKIAAINLLLVFMVPIASYASSDDCVKIDDSALAQKCLIQSGKPFARVGKLASGEKVIVEGPASIKGSYSDYVKTVDDLSSPLLLKALENEGRNLGVDVGQLDPNNQYQMTLSDSVDNKSTNSGALIASNTGPGLSSRNILTWYNKARLGEGYVLTSSLTHGFSDTHKESKGGKYEAAYLGLEKATSLGLFTLDYAYTEDNAGGDVKLYALGGTTHRAGLTLKQWVNNQWSVGNSLEYTHREQDFGVFDLSDKQQYVSYKPTIGFNGEIFSGDLSVKKGLGGSQDYNLIPLMGTFNPHFWSSTLRLNAKSNSLIASDYGVTNTYASITGFTGSEDMPSSERIQLGGSGAGSSHDSGVLSGHQGYQYQFGVTHALNRGNNPWYVVLEANVNGAEIKTVTNTKAAVNTFELGGSFNTKDWTLRVVNATSFSTKNVDKDERITAQIIWRY